MRDGDGGSAKLTERIPLLVAREGREHRATHSESPAPGKPGWRRRRSVRWTAYALAPLLLFAGIFSVVPVPFLNGLLSGYISDQIAGQVSCPGEATAPPKVTVKGARMPQLLRGRLPEIGLTIPDLTANGAKHVVFTATMRDVSQPKPGTTHAGHMDAAITIGFANLPPPPPGQPVPSGYSRAPDGALAISVTADPKAAKNVRTKLYLKMEIKGRTMITTPQKMAIFRKTLPAAKVRAMTGGTRETKLPALPSGLEYKSISPERDGLHVGIDGVTTQSFDKLPTKFDGRTVSYTSKNGLLGISTTESLLSFINIPLTIYVQPQLRNGTMTMVPKSLHILGGDHSSADPIGKLAFSQIDAKDLSRKLPALPAGLRYKSVSVGPAGIKVGVGGVTVQPYSTLPVPKGSPPTTFGAEEGLLTASTRGAGGRTMPVVVHTKPTIKGDTLDMTPTQIEMFGTVFPAADVFAEMTPQPTTFPLQALPTNLHYQAVEVLPEGLRIRLAGENVELGKSLLGGGGCPETTG